MPAAVIVGLYYNNNWEPLTLGKHKFIYLLIKQVAVCPSNEPGSGTSAIKPTTKSISWGCSYNCDSLVTTWNRIKKY